MATLPMAPAVTYRGHINMDFKKADNYSYQKLVAALIDCGWNYVRTSAFAIETTDLAIIYCGIGLVARQSAAIGELSAVTFHVQGSADFDGVPYEAAKNHGNALRDILRIPFPS